MESRSLQLCVALIATRAQQGSNARNVFATQEQGNADALEFASWKPFWSLREARLGKLVRPSRTTTASARPPHPGPPVPQPRPSTPVGLDFPTREHSDLPGLVVGCSSANGQVVIGVIKARSDVTNVEALTVGTRDAVPCLAKGIPTGAP